MNETEALKLLKDAKRMARTWSREAQQITGRKRVGLLFGDLWLVTRDGKHFSLMYFEGQYDSYRYELVGSTEEWHTAFERTTRQERAYLKHLVTTGLGNALWKGARKVSQGATP